VNARQQDGTGATSAALLQLPADLRAVRLARRFVAEQCTALGLPRARYDDALLLTSELVTNAVLHGRSEVCVEVAVRDRVVRIVVLDENSRHPQPVPQDADALDGRGLALVDAVAEQWGVDDRPLGKAVWFEMSRG
jgi:anti-sigma regulatory factor (Ser/Thr protein kinase)